MKDLAQIRKKIKSILLENLLCETTERFFMNIMVEKSHKQDIWNIQNTLKLNGYKMYIVGGAVRDAVKNAIKLQKNPMDTTLDTPKDFDLVTDAPPIIIKQLFQNKPFISNILNIGESFAIQFLVTKNGNQYELATLRSDSGGGRRPESVQIEKDPKKDAERRDLTINALFFKIQETNESGFSGIVLDYVGGISDIKNNVINTVGQPEDRFDEDPLRKIRAIRFAARMGSKIPDNVKQAITKNNTSLQDPTGKMVSSERIREEFLKGIKNAKSIRVFFGLLDELGFFKHIFGNLKVNLSDFVLEEKNYIVLIANLLKNNSVKEVASVLNEKKYSSEEINKITFLILLQNLNENTAPLLKKFYNQKLKNKYFESSIYKFADINNIDKEKIKNLLRLINEFIPPSEIIQKLGYKNQDFGKAILKLEKEFFKSPDKIKQILQNKNTDEIQNLLFINKNN